MNMPYEPTTNEMRDIWKRSGLWRDGHTFEKDIQVPVIRKTLCMAVSAQHKTQLLPEQATLPLETV